MGRGVEYPSIGVENMMRYWVQIRGKKCNNWCVFPPQFWSVNNFGTRYFDWSNCFEWRILKNREQSRIIVDLFGLENDQSAAALLPLHSASSSIIIIIGVAAAWNIRIIARRLWSSSLCCVCPLHCYSGGALDQMIAQLPKCIHHLLFFWFWPMGGILNI